MSATPVVTTPFAPVQDDEEFVTFTGLRALDEEDLVFHDEDESLMMASV